MKSNKYALIGFLSVAFAVHAAEDTSSVVFSELDVGQDTFFWNTAGHVNPVLSQTAVSLDGVSVAVSGEDATGDYLAGNTFDTRCAYDTVPSGAIRFTSEPPGLSVIVR